MEIVTIKIRKDLLEEMYRKGIKEYQVVAVNEDDYDYSGDKEWLKLKQASSKAFAELKTREFKIRNK